MTEQRARCSNCHAVIPTNANPCPRCGVWFDTEKVPTRFTWLIFIVGMATLSAGALWGVLVLDRTTAKPPPPPPAQSAPVAYAAPAPQGVTLSPATGLPAVPFYRVHFEQNHADSQYLPWMSRALVADQPITPTEGVRIVWEEYNALLREFPHLRKIGVSVYESVGAFEDLGIWTAHLWKGIDDDVPKLSLGIDTYGPEAFEHQRERIMNPPPTVPPTPHPEPFSRELMRIDDKIVYPQLHQIEDYTALLEFLSVRHEVSCEQVSRAIIAGRNELEEKGLTVSCFTFLRGAFDLGEINLRADSIDEARSLTVSAFQGRRLPFGPK